MKPPKFTPADIAALEAGLARRDAEIDAQWQLVERMLKAAFDGPREPRSQAYRAGVRSLLASRLCGQPKIIPYAMGSTEADAWLAGQGEGIALLKLRSISKAKEPAA